MKKTIGIVGIGIMGHGMAANFLKKGWTVYIWNRSPGPMADLITMGAISCVSAREVAQRADVVFELTANDDSSRSVWLAEQGIFAGKKPTSILIASATLSIPWTDELIREAQERGATFLDVPITGGRAGAENGTLTMLCGGPEHVVRGLHDIFASVSAKTYYFGSAGSGMRYKLILNFLQALHIVGFGEAMRIAKDHALNLKTVAEALADRPGGALTEIASTRYFEEPDPITFSIEWAVKDLTYAKSFAGNLKTPLLDDVLNVYVHAREKGHGKKDWASVNTIDDGSS